MVLATIIRLEFAYPGVGILAGDSIQYLSLASAHGVIMVFFMIMPLLFGAFANFLLPTQLGVHDVAFPRLNSAAFWFLPGGLLMLCQLVCVDRRYQRMNCFNIREVQSLLKRKFFNDLLNSHDHHNLLNKTSIGLRFKTNNINNVNSNIFNFYNYGIDFSSKIRNNSYVLNENNQKTVELLSFNSNFFFYNLIKNNPNSNFFFYITNFLFKFLENLNIFFNYQNSASLNFFFKSNNSLIFSNNLFVEKISNFFQIRAFLETFFLTPNYIFSQSNSIFLKPFNIFTIFEFFKKLINFFSENLNSFENFKTFFLTTFKNFINLVELKLLNFKNNKLSYTFGEQKLFTNQEQTTRLINNFKINSSALDFFFLYEITKTFLFLNTIFNEIKLTERVNLFHFYENFYKILTNNAFSPFEFFFFNNATTYKLNYLKDLNITNENKLNSINLNKNFSSIFYINKNFYNQLDYNSYFVHLYILLFTILNLPFNIFFLLMNFFNYKFLVNLLNETYNFLIN
jgi:hypothetical protein